MRIGYEHADSHITYPRKHNLSANVRVLECYGVKGQNVLVLWRLFGFVARESHFFRWSCLPRSWGYRTLRVAGRWRSAPLAFRPASFARRVGSKLGQALPQHLWPTPNQHVSSYNPRPLAPYSVNSHVIPLRLLQTLNLHRWNCNVFPRSRKITVLNYVRNLSGPGLPSPAVIAAKPYNNTWD